MNTFEETPAHAGFCRVVPHFLSPQECQRLIAESEARGFNRADSDYPPSYRNNERQVLDDAALAQQLMVRLRAHAPASLPADGAAMGSADRPGESWALDSINERLRFCRYQAGQQFGLHQDGVHHRGEGHQSRLTFMVYLTDGEKFEGGDTLFYAGGPGTPGGSQLTARVRPRAGSLILFDHGLWHAGEALRSGIKHVLRSDVLYRRQSAGVPDTPRAFQPAHQGYVWTLAALGPGLLASGGRDAAIRLWHADGRPAGQLQGQQGHRQSVLGLASLAGGRLASVSRDRSLRLWDWRAGRCDATVQAHETAVLALAELPGGLATAGADGQVTTWSAGGMPRSTLTGHAGWVWALAPLPAGRLASASEDGQVKIWNTAAARCEHTLPGTVPLRALGASPQGDRLITGDIEGTLTVWAADAEAWFVERRHRAHAAAVRQVRWLGPRLLATAGEDNHVRLWRLPGFEQVLDERHANFATDVLALGGKLFSSAYDGKIRCVDLPHD